jgi:uncharacterized secreted repeat protein (TIGR03808 family)
MNIARRRLFAAFAGAASTGAATGALAAAPVHDAPRAAIDATSLGLRPDVSDDQSAFFQRAIERAAAARAVLQLAPGFYRAGALQLPAFAAIAGVAGATRILMAGGPSLLTSAGGDHVSLSGLVLDGNGIPLPDGRGLVHLVHGRAVRIADCEIVNAGGNAIALEGIGGEVTGNTIEAGDNAIFSMDAVGLRIAANTVRKAGNGGILVHRHAAADDGTLVLDNRIDNVANKSGGVGQYGNGINIFRADKAIVRGNRISNAAYTAVRGNGASNLQIVGNTCTRLGETAIFSEFGAQGSLIANNIVDRAAVGISVANFDKGERIAVVQGNIVRNLFVGRPAGGDQSDVSSVGISVEADTVVSGNVIDSVPGTGISAGFGPYLRDVSITGNVVRDIDFGIAVSVVPGAGNALIADNLVSDAKLGAIVGMEWHKLAATDLAKETRYAHLSIGGNRVR